MPQNPPKDMHVALLIERNEINAIRLESQEFAREQGYVPTNDAIDKRMKKYQELEKVEAKGKPFIGLYYRPESGITKEDAIAIGRAEADKYHHPEKYKKESSEAELLRARVRELEEQLTKKK